DDKELAQLRQGRRADLLAEAVADVDGEEGREGIEIALAVDVLEVAPVTADDDRHVAVAVPTHAGEVHPQVILGRLLQVDDGGQLAPFERRIWTRTLPSMAATAMTKMAVPITFTCGGAPTCAAPQTNNGNVTFEPATKFVITKSSMERANESRSPARMAGAISGRVTFAKVTNSLAPRSIAASSRWRSKPISRAFTVTTT